MVICKQCFEIYYIDVILQQVIVPFVQRHNITLQQDNARAHVARFTMDYLQQNKVDVMDWPPYIADVANEMCVGHP